MEMKHVLRLKQMIIWLGFDLTNGKWGIIIPVYVMIIITLIVNALHVIMLREDIDQKLDGFEGLVLYLMCFMYFIAFALNWSDQMLLIKSLDEGLFKSTYQTVKHSELVQEVMNEILRLNTIWYYSLNGFVGMLIATPVAVFIYRCIENNIQEITIDMLYLSVPFYFPENYKTFPVFVIAFIVQSLFFAYGIRNGYLAIVSTFNSMQLIEGELRLLRQTLMDMDAIMEATRSQWQSNSHVSVENGLRMFLKHFVRHHLEILRKVDDVTKGIRLVGLSVNSGMSVLLCTAIYRVVTRDDLIVILQEVVYGSIIMFCLYCYGSMGEKVSNADEELSKALYEYPWTERPQWFKKCLQIIMARTNKTIEMRSVGLFTLNLRNFVVTLRAAYSYFNLLHSLK